MNWPEVAFGSIYITPSRNGIYKSKEFHGRGTKIINMGELFKYEFISSQEMERIELDEKETEASSLKEGDLLFGRRSLIESGAGKCSIVAPITETLTFESSIIRVRLDKNKCAPLFYYYYFSSPIGRGKIRTIVSGTNIKGIRGSDLRNLPVHIPSISTQNRTVEILSGYDNLIENNLRRMSLIEKSLRELYSEWFSRMHFTDEKHLKAINGIPQGWHYQLIEEISDVNPESISSRFDGEIQYIDIASVSPGRVDETTKYEFRDAPSRARRVVRQGDIIWSCVRPNRRSYAIIWQPPINLIVSTGFAVLRAKTVPASFLYLATTTDDFVGHLNNNAKGAAYPAVVAKDFERARLLVPKKSLLEQFDAIAKPVFEQIHVLNKQNQKLQAARDLLLPRLMSGEIPV